MIPAAGTSLAINLATMFSLLSSPIADPQYRTAADTSFKAILELPEMKKDINVLQKGGEKLFWTYSPLTEQQLAYAAYAGPIITGQLSTKPLPGLKYTFHSGFTLRPEIEYNWRGDQSLSSMLWLTRSF